MTTDGVAQRTLGRTGLRVSIVGFGAEAIGRPGRSAEEADRKLNAVVDLGVNLIDTASAYGNSEVFIGRALSSRHRRGECHFVTKCGWNSDWSPAWKPAELRRTIDASLNRLQVDALDVLLLHSCSLEDLKQGEGIEILREAKAGGKVQFIGYSGDNHALSWAVDSGRFDVVEASFNVLDQANAAAIARAHESGIGVVVKRPIANAVPGASSRPKSEYAAQYWPRWQAMDMDRSKVGGIPWLEAAVRFSAFQAGVSSVLVGSSHPDHVAEMLRAVDLGPLPVSVTTTLREVFSHCGEDWPALG